MLGKNIVILGQGSIGLSFSMIISRLGAQKVIAIDPLDYRLALSKPFGATHTINPEKEDASAVVQEITGGAGADMVVEAAGYPEAFGMALQLVRPFGLVMAFGIMTDKFIRLDHDLLIEKQVTIMGNSSARSGDTPAAVREIVSLRQRGWCDPGKLVTHHLGFSEVQKAFDMYEQRQDGIIKVVMDMNK